MAAVAMAVLGGGIFLYRRRKQPAEELSEEAYEEVVGEMATANLEPEQSTEDIEKQQTREGIEKLARQRPEEFAQVLKTWLSDE